MSTSQVESIDDDIPTLSADTLALLQSFYGDRDAGLDRLSRFKTGQEIDLDVQEQLSMSMFAEDWNASQFWYSDGTATLLAEELLSQAKDKTAIAVVSVPSVFIQLKNITMKAENAPRFCLLEYDDRFNILDDVLKYDYQKPLQLPAELKASFDIILCDPPYHSSECQINFAATVRWLSKADVPARVIICTGASMETVIEELYPGIHMTDFEIKHNQGRLRSEYKLYADFECDLWKWIGNSIE